MPKVNQPFFMLKIFDQAFGAVYMTQSAVPPCALSYRELGFCF